MADVLSAHEYMTTTRALAVVNQLRLLDRFWTAEARRLPEDASSRSERIAGLDSIVGTMDELFQEFEGLAEPLAAVFREHADSMQTTFDSLLSDEGSRLTAEERSLMRQAIVQEQGRRIAEIAENATLGARDRTATEMAAIRTGLERLRAGGDTDGDMSTEQEIFVGWIALSASLVLGPEAGGVIEAVAHIVDLIGSLFS